MREELPVGVGQGDVVLGLERSDACFRELRAEAELVLLFPEGVAAQWLERDRAQLAAQAGYAGIHGASSLVPVTLWVAVVSWPEEPSSSESEADSVARRTGVPIVPDELMPFYRCFPSAKREGSWPLGMVPPTEGCLDRVTWNRLMAFLT